MANVGDSTAVMGVVNPRYGEPLEPRIVAQVLTKDHKPEDPEEQERIKHLGKSMTTTVLVINLCNIFVHFWNSLYKTSPLQCAFQCTFYISPLDN